MSEALTTREHNGALSYRTATDVAGICKAIVTETAVNIQGRKYVRVEGWQAIAVAHGCIASARDVERIEGGVKAIGEIRRTTDGLVLATAEGFVGDDESTWGKRDEYAKRAMAQTRAISRACRSAFAHVVVLMKAGLETTPAEEAAEGFHDAPTPPRPLARHTAQPPAPKPEPLQAVTPARTEPEPQIVDDMEVLTGQIVKVSQKDGKSKSGKAYTKYGICIETDTGKVWMNTFDKELAAQAAVAMDDKRELAATAVKTQWGYDLKGLAATDLSEIMGSVEGIGEIDDNGEQVPF